MTMDQTLTRLEDMADAGLVDAQDLAHLADIADRYAIAMTDTMRAQVSGPVATDPIARQFVPTSNEAVTRDHERADPIGDDAHSPVPGIVHRYPDRVLLKPVTVCPVYCRFCFRRAVVGPGESAVLPARDLERALEYIRTTPDIWEVILTGGDPLMLSPRRIRDLSLAIADIAHVKVIRWHTRVPVVSPVRVSADAIDALATPLEVGKMVYVSIHSNHANEWTPEAEAVVRHTRLAGIALVSQTVLLAGVNDSVATLSALFRKLVSIGVQPYYLHQLDPAPGTAHFRVPLARATELVGALRGHISGLCQPTFVIDIPGGHGKVAAARSAVVRDCDTGATRLIDRIGRAHRYYDDSLDT